MKINSYMIDDGHMVYYTRDFKNLIETYLPSLRSSKENYVINVTDLESRIYNNDLNGFLLYKNIDAYLHWIVMRVNNLHSTYDLTSDIRYLYIPSVNEIDKIKQLYETKKGGIGL
jgi:hypothetical protein